ncbi:MAG: hypothetical protein L0211_07550 [Planctomycetaceae bacterium]|nr:hypothetical protein [Planctomycetaceae bacterium]
MIRLTLVDEKGNVLSPENLATIAELREAQDRARMLIRECERLMDQKSPKKAGARVPYA